MKSSFVSSYSKTRPEINTYSSSLLRSASLIQVLIRFASLCDLIAVPPQIMPFSFGEGSLTSGQPVAIQCTVLEGDMPLTLRWAFHGKELSSQMGISIIKAGPKMSLLTIDAVAAGHSGEYTCTASNSAASVNYTATLAVNGLTPQDSFSFVLFSPVLFLDNIQPLRSPASPSGTV